MSVRRAARKAVDYSQFCDELEDYSGDDDDFQDSPNPPTSKKSKSSKGSPKKADKKDKTTKTASKKKTKAVVEPKKETKLTRLSVEEKVFNRDIQAALELSQEISNGVGAVVSNGLPDTSSVDSVSEEDHAGNSKEDSDYSEEESDSEITSPSEESDDDYDEPKKKKQKQNQGTKKQNTPKPKSAAKGNVSQKSKGSQRPTSTIGTVSSAKSQLSKTTSQKPAPSRPKVAVTSPVVTSRLNSSIGSNRNGAAGLSRSAVSPGLGGVHVLHGNPSGIRLGLSRNIRVSKPLHPNTANGI